MSWNISKSGVTQDDVKKAVQGDAHVPQQIRDATDKMLSVFDDKKTLTFSTSGHVDSDLKTGSAVVSVQTEG